MTPTNIVITEIMPNPAAVSDTNGEWFELYNPTSSSVDLSGWTLKDSKSDSHVIKGSLSIGSKQYLVLGRNTNTSTNGGLKVDYQLSAYYLANSTDSIILLDAKGAEVDRVSWTSSWSINSGVSTALKSLNLDNSVSSAWCPSKDAWSGSKGDKGSPGAANSCGTIQPPKDAGPQPDGLPYLKNSISFSGASLCNNIASGTKKITLRNNHWTKIKVGEMVKLKCSYNGDAYAAKITVVRNTTWGGITPQEYQDDGFSSQASMMATLKTYYPSITLTSNATVFRWTGATKI